MLFFLQISADMLQQATQELNDFTSDFFESFLI
jgi:hypothetical protein